MIKKLSNNIRGYGLQTILTPTFVLLETLAEILIPLLMAGMIDKGVEPGDMSQIVRYGWMLLVMAIVMMSFGVGAGKTAAIASSGFAKNLRSTMFHKVQEYSFANIDKFSTASIVTRLTTDVSNVQMAFQMLIRICFRAPSMLIFALIASFGINHRLSLVFLVSLPILGVGMYFLIRTVDPVFQLVFKTYDKLNQIVQENLSAVRVVKSFHRQDFEKEKFHSISDRIFALFSKGEKIMAFAMPLMQFCMYISMLLISWIGAKMIVESGNNELLGLTCGQLLGMITYIMQILMSLMMISFVFVMLTIAKASAERIVEVLEEESDLHNPENPIYEVKDGSIDFECVEFQYGPSLDRTSKAEQSLSGEVSNEQDPNMEDEEGKKVLTDINLHIESGWMVGIIGGTGSSKSSLVQLIPRLYDVSSGKVKVGGIDVREYDMDSLRRQVAMVLQKDVLFSGTIRENLCWGNENATDEELIHACQISCAHPFIEKFEKGYDTYIEQGGTNVSGGQKQRLCIARALLKKPKILILDDSTSAVDMKTDAFIRKALREEMKDVTKIIIAQRVSSVSDADLIIVMDDGKINGVGKHEELLENSVIYREVYESQNQGGVEA